MPRIDFICTTCGQSFAEFVRFEERDSVKCPSCESSHVKQDFLGRWNGGGSGSSGKTANAVGGRPRFT
ncbi:FmdB family zinc ribbon protein [Alicyclobacillus sp. SP_1]|uniref:FmdB family zinc ribbon protein n=1 Tax=Alicyclobacillus sp. SP_1 TaxID=2942475 RepID=UPI0035BE3193